MRVALFAVLLAAAPTSPAWAQAGAGAVDSEESPELRALRLAEQEMFGGVASPHAAQAGAEMPAALTTGDGSTPPPGSAAAGSAAAGRAWLSDLSLPDFRVRWDDRILRYVEFFRDDRRGRNVMQAWLTRAERYAPMARGILREVGLPEDLVYVAMIESGFDPVARSHAAAVGMWQFVSGTGAEYGLEQNHWVDERRDPAKATEAAGRYLADLKERFGSWELALAAYNMGYGALLRAIRKYNTNDYWALAGIEAGLPFETTVYVAKVMAAAVVGENAERFGFEVADPDSAPQYEQVECPGGVSLGALARAAGLEREALEALNPELKRARTPPTDTTYALRLPTDRVEPFRERWARMRPQQPSYRTYAVRFGEDLSQIAERFQTTERALKRLNALAGGSVGPGTALLVPDVEPQDLQEEEVIVPVPGPAPALPDRREVFYRVVRGDTPANIAEFFGVAMDELRSWNGIDTDALLQPGMVLRLFVPPEVDLDDALVIPADRVRTVEVGSDEFFATHEHRNGRVRFRYTVRPGDTLSGIAHRYGLRAADLARINRIAEHALLREGQDIVVYAERDRVPPRLRAQMR